MPKNLLSILIDGEIHSGRVLGERLGVSRSGVYKQIKKLIDLGLDVVSTKGVGYQLAMPLDLISSDSIVGGLDSQLHFHN